MAKFGWNYSIDASDMWYISVNIIYARGGGVVSGCMWGGRKWSSHPGCH